MSGRRVKKAKLQISEASACDVLEKKSSFPLMLSLSAAAYTDLN